MSNAYFPDSSGFSVSSQSGWSNSGSFRDRSTPQTQAASTGQVQRAPQRRSLTDEAHVWLARLPPRYQPLATARRHPHIVNTLAALWSSPADLPRYMQDLMLSRRSDRRGFAFEVLTELSDLQTLIEQGESGWH